MPTETQTSEPSSEKSSVHFPPRQLSRGFHALANRNYRLFWTGQVISLSGTWMQTTAQAWLVLDLTGSPLSLGLVTTLQFLPVTLLALYGGVLADRLRKYRALLVTQSAAAIQALIFGLLVASGRIELWHIYVLASIQGTINAVDNPTRQAFVVEMVGRDELPNAVALNSMAVNGARIIGPSMAGIIIDRLGIAPALILNAVSFIPVLAALLWMDTSALHVAPLPERGTAASRLTAGLAYARQTPAILAVFIVVAAIGTFGYNFSIILPLLARFVLNTDATGFGSLASFLGFGSLIAALLTAYAGHVSMRRVLAGAGGFGVILGMLSLSRVYALSLALLVGLGFSGIIFATASNTLLQLLAPDALRGRIMSVYVLLFMGSTPFGGFLIGALSDGLGVQAALLFCATMCVSGTLLATLYVHRHDAMGVSS